MTWPMNESEAGGDLAKVRMYETKVMYSEKLKFANTSGKA